MEPGGAQGTPWGPERPPGGPRHPLVTPGRSRGCLFDPFEIFLADFRPISFLGGSKGGRVFSFLLSWHPLGPLLGPFWGPKVATLPSKGRPERQKGGSQNGVRFWSKIQPKKEHGMGGSQLRTYTRDWDSKDQQTRHAPSCLQHGGGLFN